MMLLKRRPLLLLLTILLLLPVPLASGKGARIGHRWNSPVIRVYDYTGPRWHGVIAQTVADANAILPRRGPRIVYRRMDARPCEGLRAREGVIIVCERATWPYGWHAGVAFPIAQHGVITKARVEFAATIDYQPDEFAPVACHEVIGHAVLGLPDGPWRAPGESCVQGEQAAPGTWDAAQAQALYGRKPNRHRGHHR
ncbi:MAG: hypothetical protein QM692_15130 [Thermomicrobiales bacterium]